MYKTLALLASSLLFASASELETVEEHGNLRERNLPVSIFCLADPIVRCDLENAPGKGQFWTKVDYTYEVHVLLYYFFIKNV